MLPHAIPLAEKEDDIPGAAVFPFLLLLPVLSPILFPTRPVPVPGCLCIINPAVTLLCVVLQAGEVHAGEDVTGPGAVDLLQTVVAVTTLSTSTSSLMFLIISSSLVN